MKKAQEELADKVWKDPERPALRLHKKTQRPSMKAALKVVEEEEPPRKKGSKKERSSGSGIKRPITEPLEEEEPEARSEKTSKTNNTNKERKKGKAEHPDKTDTKAEVKKEQESEKNVKKGSPKGSSSAKTAKESSMKRKNQHDDLAEVLRQFEEVVLDKLCAQVRAIARRSTVVVLGDFNGWSESGQHSTTCRPGGIISSCTHSCLGRNGASRLEYLVFEVSSHKLYLHGQQPNRLHMGPGSQCRQSSAKVPADRSSSWFLETHGT